ncbi:MAG: hypothetical protein PQJ59_03545 [Spirochaetales bacterium]|nr:hypothetical protein [Spirochaetales bacterium]
MNNLTRFLVLLILICLSVPVFASGNKESEETVSEAMKVSTFEDVARVLDITTDELFAALGDPAQGAPDYEVVAEKLDVDAAEFEALMTQVMSKSSMDSEVDPYTVNINGFDFEITYEVFTWDTLPEDVNYERMPILEYTNDSGETHYYELVYLKDGNLNWYQAAYLAQEAGGYMACPESDGENTFLFSQVDDMKYFWAFPEEGAHYGISIGPFLGGFQPEGSAEPAGGWTWLSGESFDYTNWAQNLDDGIIDKDPRNNTQPNDSGGDQPIMGYGELNIPVPTWGDYMETVGTYGEDKLPGRSYAFFIEYESNPATL